MVRITIQMMLAHLGCDAITATSREEAPALFEASREDISGVIMDVTMPGFRSVGTFHRLREMYGQANIIASSGDPGSLAVEGLLGLAHLSSWRNLSPLRNYSGRSKTFCNELSDA